MSYKQALVQFVQESGSCSVHKTECLSSSNLMLEFWRIPKELVAFILCWN